MASGDYDFDFVVIGSGFGGSVSACRLSEKGYRVAVMEMGRRWSAADFPATNWAVHRWFWRPKLGLRGFFNLRFFSRITVLHGCAVGGGSVTYAATLLRPPPAVWQSGTWAGLCDWQSQMPRHYDDAETMLGVTRNTILAASDALLRKAAHAAGVEHTFYATNVSILLPRAGEAGGAGVADPFFAGEGPGRSTCIACGGCMMGCRYGAKNTLDLNYLYLAEKHGACVFAETRVVDVRPLHARPDGSEGYQVHTVRSTAWLRRRARRFTCRGVVFSASALGTTELLFRLKQRGSLPGTSAQVGRHVRTNSESLIGVRIPGSPEDLSLGIAIGSGIYLDHDTHIEAVRYPSGSDAMSLLSTILTGGQPGPRRVGLWLRSLWAAAIRHPVRTYRLFRFRGWARECVILLCMQALNAHIDMRWERCWWALFRKRLVSRGDKVPTYIPQANAFAQTFARVTGGTAMSMLPEILFDIPATAHCLGGCVIGASPDTGVVDHRHRVFGYRNLYVCDGSVIGANLGVNPSLTIAALAERAMSFIPLAAENRWEDAPGSRGAGSVRES